MEHHTPKPTMLLVPKQKEIVYHACSQNLLHAIVRPCVYSQQPGYPIPKCIKLKISLR